MTVQSQRINHNAYHQCIGVFSASDFDNVMKTNEETYREIGDAMGIIYDVQKLQRLSVFALSHIYNTMKSRVAPDIPIAVIGTGDGVAVSLILTVVKVSSHDNTKPVGFFGNFKEAEAWIESWFTKHYGERNKVMGRIDKRVIGDIKDI